MNANSPLASRANRNWLVPLLIAALHGTGIAALNIPSDGSDGALVITQNTEIDLGLAVTGQWDANNSANAGKGIYDPQKWAVVFKYSSVTVQAGATVTFKNHPKRAPVVWLVQGDVTINGTVSLDGQLGAPTPLVTEGGPGGYRGGMGRYAIGASEAPGFGPGGADIEGNWHGYAGSYGSDGQNGPEPYGNPALIPLVGGSGGSGSNLKGAGGGGGGAMLIASAGRIAINGELRANGGAGSQPSGSSAGGGGSGGALRLVADELAGTGRVSALGGQHYQVGGVGRIRLERVRNSASFSVLTPDPSKLDLAEGSAPQIWLPGGSPAVRIVSIGGNPAPTDPRAEFGSVGADVTLPSVSSTTVVIETTNVEHASVVKARYTPRSTGYLKEATATVSEVVSEDPLVLRWTANVPVKDGYGAIQIKVVRP